jgi:hypothetical protein
VGDVRLFGNILDRGWHSQFLCTRVQQTALVYSPERKKSILFERLLALNRKMLYDLHMKVIFQKI